MAVSIDDKISANYNNGVPRVASVVANRVAEDGTLQCDGLAGWSTDTPVHFTTFTRSTDQFGNPSVTNQQWFKGVVNGDTITQLTKYDGLQDIGNLVGDVVEPMVTAGYLKDLVSAVLVSLAQDGSLKSKSVIDALNSADGDDQKITNPDLLGNGIVLPSHLSQLAHKRLVNASNPIALTTSLQDVLTLDISQWPTGTKLSLQGYLRITSPDGGSNTIDWQIVKGDTARTTIFAGYKDGVAWGHEMMSEWPYIKEDGIDTVILRVKKADASVKNVAGRTLSAMPCFTL